MFKSFAKGFFFRLGGFAAQVVLVAINRLMKNGDKA